MTASGSGMLIFLPRSGASWFWGASESKKRGHLEQDVQGILRELGDQKQNWRTLVFIRNIALNPQLAETL